MIWLILGRESHQIISCNIYEGDGVHQLWVTRPNGKNLKISESKKIEEVNEIKEAIDSAIQEGLKAINFSSLDTKIRR